MNVIYKVVKLHYNVFDYLIFFIVKFDLLHVYINSEVLFKMLRILTLPRRT